MASMPRSSNAMTFAPRMAFDTRYAAPPTAIMYAALCFLMALIAVRPRFGLANNQDKAGLRQHHVRELVHARGRGRTRRADNFFTHRIDRTDVIDHAIREVDRQLFALGEHIGDTFMRG